MTRRLEKIIGIVGAVLVTLFLGGFTIVFNAMNETEYKETILPILGDNFEKLTTSEGMEFLKTLGAWFGFTVVLVLVCVAVATLFVNNNRYPKRAAIFYLLAGLITLIGSQTLAYPLAFIFFVNTAFCLLRKEK